MKPARSSRRRRRVGQSAGFTLIEIVMTIVILGAVSMVLLPFLGAITHSPDPMLRQQAVALGQAMMDEILAKRWDENTASGGGPIRTGESAAGSRGLTALDPLASLATEEGSRSDYDDVDDYNGFSETNTFTNQAGSSFSLPGFTRSVQVSFIASNVSPINESTTASGSSTDSKRVVITVSTPIQENFVLVAVACNL